MPGSPPPRISSPTRQRQVIALLLGAVFLLAITLAWTIGLARQPAYMRPMEPVQLGPFIAPVPEQWAPSDTLHQRLYPALENARVYHAPEEPEYHLLLAPLQMPYRSSVEPVLRTLRGQLVGPVHTSQWEVPLPLRVSEPARAAAWQWAQWGGIRRALGHDGWELHLFAVAGWRGRELLLIYIRQDLPLRTDPLRSFEWNHRLLERVGEDLRIGS